MSSPRCARRSEDGSGAVIRPGVSMAEAELGPWCIIGEYPASAEEIPETRIGPGAVIRSHSVIYAGCSIGANFACGHGVMIRELCELGDNVSVGSHSVLEHHVSIAHGVRIHSNVFIPEFTVLEQGAWIGPGAVFTNAKYPATPGVKQSLQGARVCADAVVGAASVILPGVRLGPGCVVGAGAVVVLDVEPGTVVAGNPAQAIGRCEDIPAYREKVLYAHNPR